jgi:hypothetical protein
LLLLCAAAACDPTAKTQAKGSVAPNGDRGSKELESCARSADCAGDLRCFDGICRSTQQSVLGEYNAAVGDRELAAGRLHDAAEAYALGISHYEKEKLPTPAHLYCDQGAAVLRQPGIPVQQAELAARLLHRCLLASPAGSSLRHRALAELASLSDKGLDPMTLSRGETADQYLTGAAPEPGADSLALEVAVDSRSRAASIKKVTDYLQKAPEVKAALATCWKASFEKSHVDELTVKVPVRYGFDLDSNDDFDHAWIRSAESAAPSDPATAEATACVRQAVLPLVDALAHKMDDESRWDAALTFTLKPGEAR